MLETLTIVDGVRENCNLQTSILIKLIDHIGLVGVLYYNLDSLEVRQGETRVIADGEVAAHDHPIVSIVEIGHEVNADCNRAHHRDIRQSIVYGACRKCSVICYY